MNLNMLVEDASSELNGFEQEAEYIVQQVEKIMNTREILILKPKVSKT